MTPYIPSLPENRLDSLVLLSYRLRSSNGGLPDVLTWLIQLLRYTRGGGELTEDEAEVEEELCKSIRPGG